MTCDGVVVAPFLQLPDGSIPGRSIDVLCAPPTRTPVLKCTCVCPHCHLTCAYDVIPTYVARLVCLPTAIAATATGT